MVQVEPMLLNTETHNLTCTVEWKGNLLALEFRGLTDILCWLKNLIDFLTGQSCSSYEDVILLKISHNLWSGSRMSTNHNFKIWEWIKIPAHGKQPDSSLPVLPEYHVSLCYLSFISPCVTWIFTCIWATWVLLVFFVNCGCFSRRYYPHPELKVS